MAKSSLIDTYYEENVIQVVFLDMAKQVGQVNRVAGQMGHGSKTGHFKWVKNGFGLIGLQVGSG